MKKALLSIAIYVITISNLFSHSDHYSNIKNLNYELFRNNKLIGAHNYQFSKENNLMTVESDIKFKISKLGVDIYKYEAKSKETYENNQLIKFTSKTNQNKKKKYVNIIFDQSKDHLIIDGSSYKGNGSKEYIIGTWWNHEILKTNAQISALSGRIIKQKVTFLGKKDLILDGIKYKALHFNFSSNDKNLAKEKKLNTDVWYEEKTNIWLKAAFDKRGYWEYRLKVKN